MITILTIQTQVNGNFMKTWNIINLKNAKNKKISNNNCEKNNRKNI